jgi:hypothetical protein
MMRTIYASLPCPFCDGVRYLDATLVIHHSPTWLDLVHWFPGDLRWIFLALIIQVAFWVPSWGVHLIWVDETLPSWLVIANQILLSACMTDVPLAFVRLFQGSFVWHPLRVVLTSRHVLALELFAFAPSVIFFVCDLLGVAPSVDKNISATFGWAILSCVINLLQLTITQHQYKSLGNDSPLCLVSNTDDTCLCTIPLVCDMGFPLVDVE